MGTSGGVSHSLPYLVNCSMMFTELPLLERPAAAQAAGFDAIEFWWPFEVPVPADRDVDAFVAAVKNAGVRMTGLNFFAGDVAGADAGVVSIPKWRAEFRESVEVAVAIGEQLGTLGFNALYGVRLDGISPEEQDELALEQLQIAAAATARIGAVALIEPLSGPKPYPIRMAADAVAVVDRVRAAGGAAVGFLCDLYHLAVNQDDLDRVLDYVDRIAHVQIADAPGRGEPGTGKLDIDRHLGRLQAAGYGGWVALEYQPTVDTLESLAWLPRARRAAPAAPTA